MRSVMPGETTKTPIPDLRAAPFTLDASATPKSVPGSVPARTRASRRGRKVGDEIRYGKKLHRDSFCLQTRFCDALRSETRSVRLNAI